MKELSIIAAIQKKDRGIGLNNQLLFRISDDLKRFKQLTTGNIVIMGRKTFDSIGKALPDRTNIVITRNPEFKAEGVVVTHTLKEALEKAEIIEGRIFIIGGGQIYEEAFPLVKFLYLTVIEGNESADTFFPDISSFSIITSENLNDEKTGLNYSFKLLERK